MQLVSPEDFFKFLLLNLAWHKVSIKYMAKSQALLNELMRKKLQYATKIEKNIQAVELLIRKASVNPAVVQSAAFRDARYLKSVTKLKVCFEWIILSTDFSRPNIT